MLKETINKVIDESNYGIQTYVKDTILHENICPRTIIYNILKSIIDVNDIYQLIKDIDNMEELLNTTGIINAYLALTKIRFELIKILYKMEK